MAQARQQDQWNHTASILAMTANVNRPRNMRAFKPADFHPVPTAKRSAVAPGRSIPGAKADISVLKTVFVDQQPSSGRT